MIKVAISGTGLFVPSQTITNDELVESFNAYVAKFNAEHASEIASGELEPLQPSNSAFIESASGIKQRYVMEKEGILNPDRLHPYFKERPNSELSMMAEIAVDAGRKAMEDAGLVAADIDAVICSASNMQRAYPAMAI